MWDISNFWLLVDIKQRWLSSNVSLTLTILEDMFININIEIKKVQFLRNKLNLSRD